MGNADWREFIWKELCIDMKVEIARYECLGHSVVDRLRSILIIVYIS